MMVEQNREHFWLMWASKWPVQTKSVGRYLGRLSTCRRCMDAWPPQKKPAALPLVGAHMPNKWPTRCDEFLGVSVVVSIVNPNVGYVATVRLDYHAIQRILATALNAASVQIFS